MPHPCLYFDVKFLLESLQKHQKRRIFVQLLTTTACCTTSLMTDRVSKISFMGFGSSIQKFYEFFGLCDDISKAEQEKTFKNLEKPISQYRILQVFSCRFNGKQLFLLKIIVKPMEILSF